MEQNERVSIGFKFINEYGDEYSMNTKEEIWKPVYPSQIDFICQNLNLFLKQCGFYRENDLIFTKSINEEEYEAISEFLKEFRENKKSS